MLFLLLGTLSFSLNGKDLGLAASGLTSRVPLYASFSLYNEDDQLSVVMSRATATASPLPLSEHMLDPLGGVLPTPTPNPTPNLTPNPTPNFTPSSTLGMGSGMGVINSKKESHPPVGRALSQSQGQSQGQSQSQSLSAVPVPVPIKIGVTAHLSQNASGAERIIER